MDYLPLKNKLLEPEILALADDESRKSFLIAETITEYVSISKGDWKTYMRMKGLWLPLKNSPTDSAKIAYETLTDPDPTDTQFDMVDLTVRTFIEGLMTTLVNDIPEFSSVNKDEMLALGEKTTSWAKLNGYNPLRIGYFAKARAL